MAGFSGSSGVPKKYADDLVAQSTANLLVGGPLKGMDIDTFNSWSHRGIYVYNGYTPSTDPSYITGNVPFRDAWGLFLVADTGWGSIQQIVFNLSTGKIHRRLYQSGSWNTWTVST
jgi:hypothetical protein